MGTDVDAHHVGIRTIKPTSSLINGVEMVGIEGVLLVGSDTAAVVGLRGQELSTAILCDFKLS